MKLVLFDIDGTLIQSVKPIPTIQRFRYAIKRVFDMDIGYITREKWLSGNFNGTGDRYILWSFMQDLGITKDKFLDYLGPVEIEFTKYLEKLRRKGQLYRAIPAAQKLSEIVIMSDHLKAGVLTGNLSASAEWKLRDAGYSKFAFNVNGSDADSRNDLAKLAIIRAKYFYDFDFQPADVIVVGDTIHDLRCARSIGAKTVICAGGWHVDQEELKSAHPDLLVDSLDDPRVVKFFNYGNPS